MDMKNFVRCLKLFEGEMCILQILWIGILALCIQPTVSEYCLNGTAMVLIEEEHKLCCDGIHKKIDQHGLPQECCTKTGGKSQVYATNKKICCEGELYDLPKHRSHNSPEPVCCGDDVIFDKDSRFCCNKKAYPKSYEFAYCDDSYDVEVVVGRNQIACKHLTTDGILVKVHKLLPGYECCSTELINGDTHFCHGDKAWPSGVVVSECGEQLYDMNKNICCEGEDKMTLKPKPVLDETKVKYLGTSPDLRCLGNKIVDRDLEQIVMNDNDKKVVIPKHFLPCGDGYFDPENKRTQVDCCNGVVNHALPEMNVTCCGKEFIDKDLYQCCNNTKIGATMLCCGNKNYSRTSGLACCGTELINNTYLCCKGQSSYEFPVKKMPGHNKCCGNQTFYDHPNGRDQCCGGKVVELEQNQVCKNGHTITILPADPDKVKDKVKQSAMLPGQENVGKNLITHACPSCRTYMEPPKRCVKKFEYQVYIRDIRTKGTNTIIDVLFLEPSILRKVKMVLRTKGHCRCFEKDELYLFQSNRNIQAKVTSGVMKLRFSKKDIFQFIKGTFPQYKVDHKCKIDRYYRRPNAS